MDLSGLPLIDKSLVDALDKRYPERCYQPGDEVDDLKFYGGKRDLVRWLRLVMDAQADAAANDQDEYPQD